MTKDEAIEAIKTHAVVASVQHLNVNNMDLVKKLKDAPQGTMLYCTIVGYVKLKYVDEADTYPIHGECVLFPFKDNRDWDNVNFRKDLPSDGYNSCNGHGDTLWKYIIPVDKFDFENASFNKCDNYGSITW